MIKSCTNQLFIMLTIERPLRNLHPGAAQPVQKVLRGPTWTDIVWSEYSHKKWHPHTHAAHTSEYWQKLVCPRQAKAATDLTLELTPADSRRTKERVGCDRYMLPGLAYKVLLWQRTRHTTAFVARTVHRYSHSNLAQNVARIHQSAVPAQLSGPSCGRNWLKALRRKPGHCIGGCVRKPIQYND